VLLLRLCPTSSVQLSVLLEEVVVVVVDSGGVTAAVT
jgi:hypothetical protein